MRAAAAQERGTVRAVPRSYDHIYLVFTFVPFNSTSVQELLCGKGGWGHVKRGYRMGMILLLLMLTTACSRASKAPGGQGDAPRSPEPAQTTATAPSSPTANGHTQEPAGPSATFSDLQRPSTPSEANQGNNQRRVPASEVVEVLNNMRSTPFAIQWETGNGSTGRAGCRSNGEHFLVFASGQGFIRRGRESRVIEKQPDGSFKVLGRPDQLPYLMSFEIMPPDRLGIGNIMDKLQDYFYETGTADYPTWILDVKSVHPKFTPNLQEFDHVWISSLAIQMKREDGRLLPSGYAGTYSITHDVPFSGSYSWGEPDLPAAFPD